MNKIIITLSDNGLVKNQVSYSGEEVTVIIYNKLKARFLEVLPEVAAEYFKHDKDNG